MEAGNPRTFHNHHTLLPIVPSYIGYGHSILDEVEGSDFIVVGKLKPWLTDEICNEYILYSDGDILLAELVFEQDEEEVSDAGASD